MSSLPADGVGGRPRAGCVGKGNLDDKAVDLSVSQGPYEEPYQEIMSGIS